MVAAIPWGEEDAVLEGIADLHVHTTHSDGVDTPESVIEHALGRCELDLVAITDHDTISGAQLAASHAAERGWGGRVIVGEEVSTLDGHVLGLFLHSPIRPGLTAAETLECIRAQGGLSIAAHPFWRRARPRRMGVGALIGDLPFDAVESANGGLLPDMRRANREAASACERLGIAAVGGSDAHVKEAIGWCHTLFAGSAALDLRVAVLRGAVQPGRIRAGATGIARYLAWGLAQRHSARRAAV